MIPATTAKLCRLKIDRAEMEPTARPVNLRAHELCQNQKEKAGEIHRQRAPADPAVIDQAGDHEREKTDDDPVGLLAPKIRGDRILSRM